MLQLLVDAFVTAFIAATVFGHVLLLRALLIDRGGRHRDERHGAAGHRLTRLPSAHQA